MNDTQSVPSTAAAWSGTGAASDVAAFHTLFMMSDSGFTSSSLPLSSPKMEMDASLMNSDSQQQTEMVLPSLWTSLPSPIPSSQPMQYNSTAYSSSRAYAPASLSSSTMMPLSEQRTKTEPIFAENGAFYAQDPHGSIGDSDQSDGNAARLLNTDPTNLQRRQKDQQRRRKMHQLYEDMDGEVRRFRAHKRAATASSMSAVASISIDQKDSMQQSMASQGERTTARRRAAILGSALHTIRELQQELDRAKAELKIRPNMSMALASSYAAHTPPQASLNLPKAPLLLEHATVMMVLRDARNNRIVDVNNCFLKASGYSKADVVGRTITDVQYATARATNFPDGMKLIADVHKVDQDALDVLLNRRMAAVSTVKYFLTANGVLLKVFTTQYAIYADPTAHDLNSNADRQPQYLVCQGYLVD